MLKSEYQHENCSIARSLEVVGERWTLLLVREMLLEPRRFADLQRGLHISKNTLANRLDKLVAAGIVEKQSYTDARDWSEYKLSAKGRDLFPIVDALMAWGDTYRAPDGPPAFWVHDCGKPAGHRLVCEACGEPVSLDNVQPVAGPGA